MSESGASDFDSRVRANQLQRRSQLNHRFDFIVCGSGSAGSVVARRLAENSSVSVLLLEAGESDEAPEVTDATLWPRNVGSEREWGFKAVPNPHIHGRVIPMSMGRILGGGSSINAMIWARGHRSDWDFFAAEAGDPAWNYQSVLQIYRRIEDWHGVPDPKYRGIGGPCFVQPAPNPNPVALAMVAGACEFGIPYFENQNGRLMESDGGACISDIRVREGRRQSIFRSYVYPLMDRPNLTVLTGALVRHVLFERSRAVGVEVLLDGQIQHFCASSEVVLSLGAIQTPKVLMQSGVGDAAELRSFGIPLVQHLPGVGRNLQDHPSFHCVWESPQPIQPRNNAAEATLFWKSGPQAETPDIQLFMGEFPRATPEVAARFEKPERGWTVVGCLARPKSRGQVRLTGPLPESPVQIEANHLSHPDDFRAAVAAVRLSRELGNSDALAPFAVREAIPGKLEGAELERFVRDATFSFWHQTGTAKMGVDARSVVNSRLEVYGVENLRVVDGSIMPRVTTGNTMAPCVVIGERAAEVLRTKYEI